MTASQITALNGRMRGIQDPCTFPDPPLKHKVKKGPRFFLSQEVLAKGSENCSTHNGRGRGTHNPCKEYGVQ